MTDQWAVPKTKIKIVVLTKLIKKNCSIMPSSKLVSHHSFDFCPNPLQVSAFPSKRPFQFSLILDFKKLKIRKKNLKKKMDIRSERKRMIWVFIFIFQL